ncbi:hypothetical protein BDY19DRAFT_995472 [Irpex rosettiformis]|uniref:Uncharacterized protein n=1 Tax=Irpex rosettiformis TaxID=378272 RepID=A0ACB8TYM3_9APHY|nr:hypothetical protein BDY19DRAFT_995472 [Irpex rosettiformis]
MGRNAKFLKKVKKTTASQHSSTSTSQKPSASQPVVPIAEQKKKAGLKAKAYKRKPGSTGHVLGGADYVELMMGSRRNAMKEAAKLPKDPEDS